MEAKIIARFVTTKTDAFWIASVEGGPQDLLKRRTEAQALRDGAAYVAAYYARRDDGTWVAV